MTPWNVHTKNENVFDDYYCTSCRLLSISEVEFVGKCHKLGQVWMTMDGASCCQNTRYRKSLHSSYSDAVKNVHYSVSKHYVFNNLEFSQ
jgi:hypothetical protein